LNDEEGSAEIEEALGGIDIREEVLKHVNKLFFSILFVDHRLVSLDMLEAVVEGCLTVILYHIGGELLKVTWRDVDHLLGSLVVTAALSKPTVLGVHARLLFAVLVALLFALDLLWSWLSGLLLGELVHVLAIGMGEELRILVTLLVDLWWLISTQIHHLDLLCSSVCFSLVSFGLLHGL
jgi:hypothetical protein